MISLNLDFWIQGKGAIPHPLSSQEGGRGSLQVSVGLNAMLLKSKAGVMVKVGVCYGETKAGHEPTCSNRAKIEESLDCTVRNLAGLDAGSAGRVSSPRWWVRGIGFGCNPDEMNVRIMGCYEKLQGCSHAVEIGRC